MATTTIPSAQVDEVVSTGPVVRVFVGTDVWSDAAEEAAVELAKDELGTDALPYSTPTISGYEVVFDGGDLA